MKEENGRAREQITAYSPVQILCVSCRNECVKVPSEVAVVCARAFIPLNGPLFPLIQFFFSFFFVYRTRVSAFARPLLCKRSRVIRVNDFARARNYNSLAHFPNSKRVDCAKVYLIMKRGLLRNLQRITGTYRDDCRTSYLHAYCGARDVECTVGRPSFLYLHASIDRSRPTCEH